MWSNDSRKGQQQPRTSRASQGGGGDPTGNAFRNQINSEGKDSMFSNDDYLYRESQNVSHTDTILDMAILDTDYLPSSGSSIFQNN